MTRQSAVMRRNEGQPLEAMGTQLRFLCTADKTDQRWSVLEATVPEKAGPPPHEHPWDEAYYVVEGEVRFQLGDREDVLKAGDFVHVPSGMLHGFSGASARPARVLVFDTPAHAESFFHDVAREVKELPRDLAKVPQIGARHQIRFAPPKTA